MVKPLALLLAAALLALTHEQKYATPKEAKAKMCLRGIFQEGGDTAGFIDCSMVRRGVGVIWLAAHIHLSAGREPPPQLPHPCSLFLLDLLVGAAHHPTYNAHPHVHCARPYAALGPPRAHTLYYPSPSHQRRGAAADTSPARADAPSSPPSHPVSAPHHCVRCTFEPPALASPTPPGAPAEGEVEVSVSEGAGPRRGPGYSCKDVPTSSGNQVLLTNYKNEHDVDFHLAENVVGSAVHKSTAAWGGRGGGKYFVYR